MPAHKDSKPHDSVQDRLSRYNEVTIHVTGRKSGKTISLPVWFVWEDDTLNLLPVKGSDTQWFKNVSENHALQIDLRGAEADVKPQLVTDPKQVSSVVEKFREKYGPSDVKKYYSKFDVAVLGRIA
jgi:hypothetical protein